MLKRKEKNDRTKKKNKIRSYTNLIQQGIGTKADSWVFQDQYRTGKVCWSPISTGVLPQGRGSLDCGPVYLRITRLPKLLIRNKDIYISAVITRNKYYIVIHNSYVTFMFHWLGI